MKYFLDTEFIEGFHKPTLGKRRHFIDLISIGIHSETGESLYLISRDYDYKKADKWVKDNVILPLYRETVNGDQRNFHDASNFHKFYGLSNSQIAKEIKRFIYDSETHNYNPHYDEVILSQWVLDNHPPIEFYAYYADYDWVVFCSLFGRMIDLPKAFPMYCRDLKQMLDETEEMGMVDGKFTITSPYEVNGDEVGICASFNSIKDVGTYPKQKNEHTALADAKWNFELYKFLKELTK